MMPIPRFPQLVELPIFFALASIAQLRELKGLAPHEVQ